MKKEDKFNILFVSTTNIQPSLSFGYLISYFKKYSELRDDFCFEIFECERLLDIIITSPNEIVRKAKKFDVVCFSTITEDYNFILKTSNEIHDAASCKIFFGGHHISALPEKLPSYVDVGLIGEAEETFKELLELLARGEFKTKNLKNIDGIVYHNARKTIITKKRKMIWPLDNIPPPAREYFSRHHRGKKYWYSMDELAGKRVGVLSASRGCPFSCIFCDDSLFWNNSIRWFSEERIVDEIKELIEKYEVDLIKFNDNLGIYNKEKLRKVIELLRKQGLLNRFKVIKYQLRVDLIDDELIELLKVFGVREITLGIETQNKTLLKELKGGKVTPNMNKKVILKLLKNGFFVWPEIIVGIPGEDEHSLRETLKITNIKGVLDYHISLLIPYPGTPIWSYAKEKGLVSDNMDWEELRLELNEKTININVFLSTMDKQKFKDIIKPYLSKNKRVLTVSNVKSRFVNGLKLLVTNPRTFYKVMKEIL